MQICAYLVILKEQFSNSYVSIPYGIHKWCDSTTVLPIRLIATTELTCKPCELQYIKRTCAIHKTHSYSMLPFKKNLHSILTAMHCLGEKMAWKKRYINASYDNLKTHYLMCFHTSSVKGRPAGLALCLPDLRFGQ